MNAGLTRKICKVPRIAERYSKALAATDSVYAMEMCTGINDFLEPIQRAVVQMSLGRRADERVMKNR